ncbi:MAG: zinc-ribbon domain-containing protein [Promethearchaeota archaeon]
MFCPNCGEKLENQNQNFCPNCGSELSNTPQAPQAEENQVPLPVKSAPVYESKTINVGGPGPHSKKCLTFAILSLALGGVGFAFGSISFLRILIPFPFQLDYFIRLIFLIIAAILNITGFVFGILSRTNSSKAGKFEPVNTLEKVGSVFGIFGIIMNSLPIVSIPLILLGFA